MEEVPVGTGQQDEAGRKHEGCKRQSDILHLFLKSFGHLNIQHNYTSDFTIFTVQIVYKCSSIFCSLTSTQSRLIPGHLPSECVRLPVSIGVSDSIDDCLGHVHHLNKNNSLGGLVDRN